MANITVKKSEPPETKEVLASAILQIGNAAKEFERGGLNQKALIVLLNDYSGVGKTDIKTILEALPRLHGWYCR